MKTARLAVLGVALAAGGGAAYLMMGTKPPEPVLVRLPPPPPPVPMEAILVAAHDLNRGSALTEADMRWQPLPNGPPPLGSVARSLQPQAFEQIKGQFLHTSLHAGDLLRPELLSKDNNLSDSLPAGMRAVAIDLAELGKTSAGGFILPGNQVDVIRTFHPDDAPMAFASETILASVRVLAVGPSAQDKASEHTAFGSTATLELTPAQAEKVILAQRTGQLSLSLRSAADAASTDTPPVPLTMTIIRSGNASQARVR